MLTSEGTNLCFDFHGKDKEVFDLISDPENGIFNYNS